MSEYGRCRRKPLFVSYHAVCKATECADKIFAGHNFTPVCLRVKKWRGQNFADKRAKFIAAAIANRVKKRERLALLFISKKSNDLSLQLEPLAKLHYRMPCVVFATR